MHSFARQLLITLAAFALVPGSSWAHAMRRDAPTDRWGLPTLSADGGRIVHTQAELAGRVSVPSGVASPARSLALAPILPVAWGFPVFGSGIGASGMLVLPTSDGPPELVVGGNSYSNFGGDNFWQVLQSNGRGYHSVFCSEMYSSTIVRLLAGHPSSAANEIVVLLTDGSVLRFDASSRFAVGSFTLPFHPNSARLRDLDGDGKDELIVVGDSSLAVFDANGTQLWSVAAGGSDVEVGQMDADPALEIAVTSGAVIDAATHGIQWSYPRGFGSKLRCHDIDGDGKDELIVAESWNFVWAYDVDLQLPKWSLPTKQDIDAIEVADVNGDGSYELLVGDGQWGSIHAVDMATRTELWAAPNPDHGVTNIVAGDFDQNGAIEVAWGAGWTSTGPDHLYVATSAVAGAIKWRSIDLDGPFIGPEVGDVDGDGVDEIVVGVPSTDSGYGGGLILVFDGLTHELLASGPSTATGKELLDLRLRNVDDGPALEIVVGWDQTYNGVAEIFDFDRAGGKLVSRWTNALHPNGVGFTAVDAGDLDGDGAIEVIGGGRRDHTGADGVYTYVYNYATGAEKWHTFQLGPYWGSVARAAIVSGGTGSSDLVVCIDGDWIYVFDGATGNARQILYGAFKGLLTSSDADSRTLYAWDAAGDVSVFRKTTGNYELVWTTTTSPRVYGLTPLSGLWLVGAGSRLSLQTSLSSPPAWTTPVLGPNFGRRVAVAPQGYAYSAGDLGLFAFAITVPTHQPRKHLRAAGAGNLDALDRK